VLHLPLNYSAVLSNVLMIWSTSTIQVFNSITYNRLFTPGVLALLLLFTRSLAMVEYVSVLILLTGTPSNGFCGGKYDC
jgi:hypothetical protein